MTLGRGVFAAAAYLWLLAALTGCKQAGRIAWIADARGVVPLQWSGSPHQFSHDQLLQRRGLSNYLMGVLAEAKGEMEQAQRWYLRANKEDPEGKQVLLRLGALQLRLNQIDEAIASFESATRLDEADPRARFLLGVLYSSQERFDEAAHQYAQVLTQDPGNLGALSHLADLYILQEKLTEGLEVYEQLLKERPDSSVAHFNVGVLYAKVKQWDDAISHMSRAVELNPNYVEARLGLAVSLEMTDQLQEAKVAFLEALELEPVNTLLIHYLARISYRLGELEESARWLTRYLSFRPRDYDAHLELGYIRIEQGNWEEAVRQIQYALEFHTFEESPVDLWTALGLAYASGRQYPSAEQAYLQAMALGPREPKPYLYLGALYHRMGRYLESEKIYQEAIRWFPDNPDLNNSFGYLYADWGRKLEEAVRLVTLALSTDPQNGAYLDTLGWAYFKMGRLEEALEILLEAAEESPEAEIFLHLGQVYLEQGDLDAAQAAWVKGLSLDPANPELLMHLKGELNQGSDNP